jgi:hypothetical protein
MHFVTQDVHQQTIRFRAGRDLQITFRHNQSMVAAQRPTGSSLRLPALANSGLWAWQGGNPKRARQRKNLLSLSAGDGEPKRMQVGR